MAIHTKTDVQIDLHSLEQWLYITNQKYYYKLQRQRDRTEIHIVGQPCPINILLYTVAEVLPIQIHLRLFCSAAILYYSVPMTTVSGERKVNGKRLHFRTRLVWIPTSALMLTSCATSGK